LQVLDWRKPFVSLLACTGPSTEGDVTARCGGSLEEGAECLLCCESCGLRYPIIVGVPHLATSSLIDRPGTTPENRLKQYLAMHYGAPETPATAVWRKKASSSFDEAADQYYRELLRLIEPYVMRSEPTIVLEVGCAVGRLTYELAAAH
jgi:uncharacterized protein YbaR (Trm112 family)